MLEGAASSLERMPEQDTYLFVITQRVD